MSRMLVFSIVGLGVLLVGCSSAPEPKAAPKRAEPPPPVKIVQFYASPGAVESGDSVTLCYGVENATAVRLEPAIEAISPASNRCVQFTPSRTRTYTLIATGTGGREASESLAIRVEPRAAGKRARPVPDKTSLIDTFAASSENVSPGQPVTLCYVVRGALSVRIEPSVGPLAAGERNCAVVKPAKTVTYTLTASGNGRSDQQSLTIRVR